MFCSVINNHREFLTVVGEQIELFTVMSNEFDSPPPPPKKKYIYMRTGFAIFIMVGRDYSLYANNPLDILSVFI